MFSSSPGSVASPRTSEIHPLPESTRVVGRQRPRLLPLLVMGIAVPAIFCTVALPAYTYQANAAHAATAELEEYKAAAAQSVDVIEAAPAAIALDGYTATSATEMARLARVAALEAARAAYGGPSVRDLLANPPYPGYDPSTIVSIAMQYLGSPYVFGGASPAGFDCSGFTQFVFAHVGISLPHSSSAQGRMTAIAPEAAMAGDLVITDGGGHVGIYLGDGTMIHASTPATGVKISKPWGNYWIVRVGI